MFIMGRTRRGFTPEYKDEAVKLVINTGRTVATVARELGIQESTLGRWVHDFRARAAAGEAGQGGLSETCLLYTSDAADDLTRVDLGGRRIIKKKKKHKKK